MVLLKKLTGSIRTRRLLPDFLSSLGGSRVKVGRFNPTRGDGGDDQRFTPHHETIGLWKESLCTERRLHMKPRGLCAVIMLTFMRGLLMLERPKPTQDYSDRLTARHESAWWESHPGNSPQNLTKYFSSCTWCTKNSITVTFYQDVRICFNPINPENSVSLIKLLSDQNNWNKNSW